MNEEAREVGAKLDIVRRSEEGAVTMDLEF